MKRNIRSLLCSITALILLVGFISCGGSSSSGTGTATGSTLTGTVDSFTASLSVEKKSLYAQVKDFFLSKANAAASGVTVSVGDETTTTATDGSFTLTDIATGDQTVTFTDGSSSATYSLDDVSANETFTLNDISIAGGTVSTANTGTWTGTMIMDSYTGSPIEVTLTLTIEVGGNTISGGMTIVGEGVDEVGVFSGTENGITLDARWANTEPDDEGCMLSGPLTGTFDGDTLTGNEPIDDAGDCELHPGDDEPDSHPFTLTKS